MNDAVAAYRASIVERYPELGGESFSLLAEGWDSVAVDVGGALIFKFPRQEEARVSLQREARLLEVIGPRVSMAVPDLRYFAGPPAFSRHAKIPGEHLLADQYVAVSEIGRDRLAADMALFMAETHALPREMMVAAGARAIGDWLSPEEILRLAWPVLDDGLRGFAAATVDDWIGQGGDPLGEIYGHFDGHGWNMAFDHQNERLNGIYDFADSGFGPLHQDFVYANWISPDLTARIIDRYEALTGRLIDRRRVEVLSGIIRLSELAEYAGDEQHRPAMLATLRNWVGR